MIQRQHYLALKSWQKSLADENRAMVPVVARLPLPALRCLLNTSAAWQGGLTLEHHVANWRPFELLQPPRLADQTWHRKETLRCNPRQLLITV